MITPTVILETKLLQTYRYIAGVDEVGRGPLAGPVVSAAVILNPITIGKRRSKNKWWATLRDSKILSPRKRGSIAEIIKSQAIDFAVGLATHQEIDEFNVNHATALSMNRALSQLAVSPEMVLVDGKFQIPNCKLNQRAVVDGDASILSIAAASILAKVYRDELMTKFAEEFSDYGFEKHKGYDTNFHRNRLLQFGPCPIHRMTFAPVRDIITKRFDYLWRRSQVV